ncbi:uncharacterized protein CBL_06445 [Carabus blaptoides fortunei]
MQQVQSVDKPNVSQEIATKCKQCDRLDVFVPAMDNLTELINKSNSRQMLLIALVKPTLWNAKYQEEYNKNNHVPNMKHNKFKNGSTLSIHKTNNRNRINISEKKTRFHPNDSMCQLLSKLGQIKELLNNIKEEIIEMRYSLKNLKRDFEQDEEHIQNIIDKTTLQLQIEVDTEEDWNKLIQREGLIVVDVYSDWCGPCGGMLGNLRKLKLELGGDTLTLAAAKSDNIECLERFRNKSEPTWMFISGGRMIRLMFGANAPRLVNIITEEIMKERKAIADKTPRDGIQFDQLTEEEQERVNEETQIAEEAARIEREERERKINERREEIVNNMMDYIKEYNFIMLWPHVNNDGVSLVLDVMKDTELTVASKPLKVQLTEDNIFEIMYYCTWDYSEDALEELAKGEVTALLFQAPLIDFEDDVIKIVINKMYGDEDSPAHKLSTIIEKEIVTKEIVEEEGNEKEEQQEEHEPEMLQCEIPGIFVPENEKVKAATMRILFPLVTQKFDLPEPEPIPPHLLIAFDAFKKSEVLQLIADYPAETMHIGFFTSSDPENATLIAKTMDQYEKIPVPPYDGKLILQVSRKHSEPVLSYSLLGPTYVSPNTVVGDKECAIFFPEDYEEPEPEIIEEVKKKQKKRGRGSKTSVTSITASKTSEESIEGQIATDDALDLDVLKDYEDGAIDMPAAELLVDADKATSPMENVPEA